MSQKRVAKTKSVKKSGKKTTPTISKKTKTRAELVNDIVKITKKHAKKKGSHYFHTPLTDPFYTKITPISEQAKETIYSMWIPFTVGTKRTYIRIFVKITHGGKETSEIMIEGEEKPKQFSFFNKKQLTEIVGLMIKNPLNE